MAINLRIQSIVIHFLRYRSKNRNGTDGCNRYMSEHMGYMGTEGPQEKEKEDGKKKSCPILSGVFDMNHQPKGHLRFEA